MAEYADLEIILHEIEGDSYPVELRFDDPTSEVVQRIGPGQEHHAKFDLSNLRGTTLDPALYGAELTKSLFADGTVMGTFTAARAVAEEHQIPLRVRLVIESDDLHSLRWETLLDPNNNTPIATSDRIRFSRFLHGPAYEKVVPAAKGDLTALVVAANPSQLAEFNLPEVEVEEEIERVRQALEGIGVTVLPDGNRRPTLNTLISMLRRDEYDIVYLVCHGQLVGDEPWLWLEGDAEKDPRVKGVELATRIADLSAPPRLMVLASCESAASDSGDALAAIGPRLAGAGVPAVLAMQGKIEMETVARFMPTFFQEIDRDGEVDRAVAIARAAVRDEPDYWMPTLYMRLKSGRIWYVPGFDLDQEDFKKWIDLVAAIQDEKCTPILGPALSDALIAPRREIAQAWADKHGFPLAEGDRELLHRVAQYVATIQSPSLLPSAYREVVRETMIKKYAGQLPEDLRDAERWTAGQLSQALESAAAQYCVTSPDNVYRQLARLRLPVYVITSPLDVMNQACMLEGATPVVRVCPWNDRIKKDDVLYDDAPTPDKPLVYHLFGHVGVDHSLVYSEDNFYDYLIGLTRDRDLIPVSVKEALSDASLLFLGFELEDPEFRVFFRFIMAQDGKDLLREWSHAAIQLEPQEEHIIDARRARSFFDEYFADEHIDTYWGTAEEFMSDLSDHLS